ncbi:MAG: energy-coupling factor transporter transmembrane protein EcfT [Spirochaetaceae bacterium]|jgi:biotin transport system permease protein|nr:energy-coupling factor transporter transmembrane protein EcfT [Spirochaetaceae bacterium]
MAHRVKTYGLQSYGASPYAYRPGTTALHRLPAGLKLLGLLGISLGAFAGPGLLLAAGLLVAGALGAGIPPWQLLRGIKPLVILMGLVMVLRALVFDFSQSWLPVFSVPGFWAALRFGGGIMVSFAAGALLFSVTTMTELRESLGRGEIRIRMGWYDFIEKIEKIKNNNTITRKPSRTVSRNSPVSLGISLLLAFLPRFFEVWGDAETAYRARAGKRGIVALAHLIPLVTERMISMAVETAYAMETRGASLEAEVSLEKP